MTHPLNRLPVHDYAWEAELDRIAARNAAGITIEQDIANQRERLANLSFNGLVRELGYKPRFLRRMIGDLTDREAIMKAMSTRTAFPTHGGYCVNYPSDLADLADAYMRELEAAYRSAAE